MSGHKRAHPPDRPQDSRLQRRPPPPELPPRRRSCSAAVRRTSCARPRPRSRSSRKPCATPARCGASRRRRDSPGSCSGGRSGARGAARAPHSTACSLSPAWALPLIERASPASSRHPRPVPLASSTSSGGGGFGRSCGGWLRRNLGQSLGHSLRVWSLSTPNSRGAGFAILAAGSDKSWGGFDQLRGRSRLAAQTLVKGRGD